MVDLFWTQVIGGILAAVISAGLIGTVRWIIQMKSHMDVLFEKHNELAARFSELATRFSEMDERRDKVCAAHMKILSDQQTTLHRLDINIVRLCEKSGSEYQEG